jgi:hypothetical protein
MENALKKALVKIGQNRILKNVPRITEHFTVQRTAQTEIKVTYMGDIAFRVAFDTTASPFMPRVLFYLEDPDIQAVFSPAKGYDKATNIVFELLQAIVQISPYLLVYRALEQNPVQLRQQGTPQELRQKSDRIKAYQERIEYLAGFWLKDAFPQTEPILLGEWLWAQDWLSQDGLDVEPEEGYVYVLKVVNLWQRYTNTEWRCWIGKTRTKREEMESRLATIFPEVEISFPIFRAYRMYGLVEEGLYRFFQSKHLQEGWFGFRKEDYQIISIYEPKYALNGEPE